MNEHISKLMDKFNDNLSNISHNKIYAFKTSTGATFITTDYYTYKYSLTSEKAYEDIAQTQTDVTEFNIADISKLTESDIQDVDNISNAMYFLKPHFVNESTHEPIFGKKTIVFANDKETLKRFSERTILTHIYPGIEDHGVDNSNIMKHFSISIDSVVDGNCPNRPNSIYMTCCKTHLEASKDLTSQITNELFVEKSTVNTTNEEMEPNE